MNLMPLQGIINKTKIPWLATVLSLAEIRRFRISSTIVTVAKTTTKNKSTPMTAAIRAVGLGGHSQGARTEGKITTLCIHTYIQT